MEYSVFVIFNVSKLTCPMNIGVGYFVQIKFMHHRQINSASNKSPGICYTCARARARGQINDADYSAV